MKILRQAFVLLGACAMMTPMLSAQSIWQKVKQAAQQAERNAQAQQHRAKPTSAQASSARNSQSASSDNSSTATALTVDVDSPAMKALYRKLDVDGVQVGMKPDEAAAILLRRTPDFLEQKSTPYVFTDLPDMPLTSSIHFRSPTTDAKVILGLTLHPMQPEVLSIFRYSEYEMDHQPTIVNTVAALRAKYGPESIQEDAMDTKELVWVFDGEGKVLSKAGADKVRSACSQNFREPTAGWVNGDGVQPHWKENCGPYTIVFAGLTVDPRKLNSHGQSLPPGLLWKLQQVVMSYPLFTKTLAETRQVVLAAKAANLQKTKKAADKNAPVL